MYFDQVASMQFMCWPSLQLLGILVWSGEVVLPCVVVASNILRTDIDVRTLLVRCLCALLLLLISLWLLISLAECVMRSVSFRMVTVVISFI